MPFTAGNTVNLAVTASNGTVAIPGPLPTPGGSGWTDVLLVQNIGTKECFIALGSSSVVAVVPTTSPQANCFPIEPSTTVPIQYSFKITSQTTLAAICGGSDTTTLRLSSGTGSTVL